MGQKNLKVEFKVGGFQNFEFQTSFHISVSRVTLDEWI